MRDPSWRRQLLWGDWPLLLACALVLAAGLWLAPRLPDQLPTHWNLAGEIDGWSPKWGVLLGLPAAMAGLYFLMGLLPRLDPGQDNYPRFLGPYRLTRAGVMGILLFVWALSVGHGLGMRLRVERWVPALLGLFFAAIGNQLGRIRHNYFFGVRTPWTLAHEEVWRRTHRLAGPVWVLGGSAAFLAAVLLPVPLHVIAFAVALAAMVLVPTVYSYVAYRRLTRR